MKLKLNHSYGAKQNLTLRDFVLLGLIITKLCTIDYVVTHQFELNFTEWQISCV